MERLKFPHLDALAQGQSILEAQYVTVTEKIDGFNARFGLSLDGEPWVGTRNREIGWDEPMQGFTAYAKERVDRLTPGVTIFGEWAGKGVQKRLDYGPPDFYFFDGHHGANREMPDGGSWFDPDDMDEHASRLEMRRPRLFHAGPPPGVAQLDEWRRLPGIEGIVIRAYPMMVDKYGHAQIVKFKSPEFSETSREKLHMLPADLDAARAFVHEYVTAERLTHVLNQVAEMHALDGLDPLDVRCTGDVLRAMYNDIVREGSTDFEELAEKDQKLVGRVCSLAAKVLLDAARLERVEVAS